MNPLAKSGQLRYEEGPKLSLGYLRDRIEQLEERNTLLEARLQRLHEWVETLHDGAMSQVQELQYTVSQVEDHLSKQ